MTSPGDWVLAIDFGTTNTVAAMTDAARHHDPHGRRQTGHAVRGFPESGPEDLVGGRNRDPHRPAQARVVRANPKRSVPDGMLFLGGENVPVGEAITAVLRPIISEAVNQHGGRSRPPSTSRTPRTGAKRGWRSSSRRPRPRPGRGWPSPQHLSEPVAAAQAILGMADIPPQARLVVLDLGGGTVDATVVDRDGDNPHGRRPAAGTRRDRRRRLRSAAGPVDGQRSWRTRPVRQPGQLR